MNTLTIELMTSKDFTSVSKLIIDAFNKSPFHENWTMETGLARIKQAFDAKFSFIAKQNNNTVGALVAYILYESNQPYLLIDILAVQTKIQNNGIGQQLLDRAFENAKHHGIKRVTLLAHPQLPSYEWYKKQGFSETGWVDLEKSLV